MRFKKGDEETKKIYLNVLVKDDFLLCLIIKKKSFFLEIYNWELFKKKVY